MSDVQSEVKRLYLMQVASIASSGVPFVCYLVQTDDKNILIDSGLPTTIQAPSGREAPLLGKSVVEQLAEIGLQPADIDTLIITHFDGDHIGQIDKFPQAKLVAQRAQFDHAMGGESRFAQMRPLWDLPVERYSFVDGDSEVVPGLWLIHTTGHVKGHQSVLVRLPKRGSVLLTIDAVPNAASFSVDREAGPANQDEVAVLASTKKLLALAEQEDASLVIFGHDPVQWQTLKKLRQYYD